MIYVAIIRDGEMLGARRWPQAPGVGDIIKVGGRHVKVLSRRWWNIEEECRVDLTVEDCK